MADQKQTIKSLCRVAEMQNIIDTGESVDLTENIPSLQGVIVDPNAMVFDQHIDENGHGHLINGRPLVIGEDHQGGAA